MRGLGTLTLTGCTGLTALDARGCMSLETLNVSDCTALNALAYSNGMTVIGYALTVHAKQVILDGSINMAFYVPMTAENAAANNETFTKSAAFSGGAANGKFRSDLTITEDETTYYAFVGEVTSI